MYTYHPPQPVDPPDLEALKAKHEAQLKASDAQAKADQWRVAFEAATTKRLAEQAVADMRLEAERARAETAALKAAHEATLQAAQAEIARLQAEVESQRHPVLPWLRHHATALVIAAVIPLSTLILKHC